MARDLPESDWKVFRKVRKVALERFCARILSEIQAIALKNNGPYHARYLEIYALIGQRDDELARAFNNPRRSSAALQLTLIKAHGLLTDEEIADFSPQTRECMESLASVVRRPKKR